MAVDGSTKLGRPTKYLPEYNQRLIDHMAQGFSFETFAATIDCASSTLYVWEKEYPGFLEAKGIAFDKCMFFWEKKGMDLVDGKVKGSAPAWIYSMKCRFPGQWTEKKEIQLSGEVKTSDPELVKKELEELKKMLKEEV